MTDVFDKEKRSWVMSRIHGKDTKPELLIRSMIHRLGYRFTVKGPGNRKLPGKPDIVLPKHKTVVFVHGCFWHGHVGCKHYRLPRTRTEWWRAKIEGNRLRDQRNVVALELLGWNVVQLWTCEFNTIPLRETLVKLLPDLIEHPLRETYPLQVAESAADYGKKRPKAKKAG